jgi:hypothetical protein
LRRLPERSRTVALPLRLRQGEKPAASSNGASQRIPPMMLLLAGSVCFNK